MSSIVQDDIIANLNKKTNFEIPPAKSMPSAPKQLPSSRHANVHAMIVHVLDKYMMNTECMY